MRGSCLVVLVGSLLVGGCAAKSESRPSAQNRSSEPLRAANHTSDPAPAGKLRPATQPVAAARAGSDDRVVATINGSDITLQQLQAPLIEGYGLNILLNLVQLELAKQEAAGAGVVVSPQDIETERELTMHRMFEDADKSDYDSLFEQFLQQQRITKAEFDIVLTTNTYLRKIAEPQLAGKITDESLEEAFRQLYGETVQVRHIQCANMTEILEAKRRLAEGVSFEQVARELSRNDRTAGLGGELPPFSRAAQGLPQAFKDTAFSLKPGEVSDPVQADGAFHLIKLDNKIPPKAVKFEDVKDSVRTNLQDRLLQATTRQMRAQIAQQALTSLKIEDPQLRAQFEARKHRQEAQVRDRDQINKDLEKERERIRSLQDKLAQELATQPATDDVADPALPATSPATQP